MELSLPLASEASNSLLYNECFKKIETAVYLADGATGLGVRLYRSGWVQADKQLRGELLWKYGWEGYAQRTGFYTFLGDKTIPGLCLD